ncbi:MAG TPA: arginine deiminase-related protein [Steroidobacteraceae bacterium]|nr:arginine deiminase-related protein [Steroidobacteraceae bacterium]
MNAPAAAERQCADAVLMIRPARFGANPETAESNRFQQGDAGAGAASAAWREFDGLVEKLRAAGVEVHVAEDTPDPPKPDACFPNNWVSFHADGTAVLYPMMAPSRRAERRPELVERLRDAGFRIARTVDLSGWESRGEFLEGTGSLVLDRCHRIAYACRSPRTTAAALADFAARLGYRTVVFDARGPAAEPLYHTNVMMAIGEGFAVVCAEAIPDAGERMAVLGGLAAAGHEPIEIGAGAMHGFAGNLLALRSRDGAQLIAMSEAAWASLPAAARAALERHGRIVTGAIPVIERHGGGSVRCMIAEVFLPRERR